MFTLYLMKRVALPTDNSRTARFIPDSTLIPHLTCLISSNTLCIEILDIHYDIYMLKVYLMMLVVRLIPGHAPRHGLTEKMLVCGYTACPGRQTLRNSSRSG